LITFELIVIFWASWGSSENWIEPKTKPPNYLVQSRETFCTRGPDWHPNNDETLLNKSFEKINKIPGCTSDRTTGSGSTRSRRQHWRWPGRRGSCSTAWSSCPCLPAVVDLGSWRDFRFRLRTTAAARLSWSRLRTWGRWVPTAETRTSLVQTSTNIKRLKRKES